MCAQPNCWAASPLRIITPSYWRIARGFNRSERALLNSTGSNMYVLTFACQRAGIRNCETLWYRTTRGAEETNTTAKRTSVA